MTRTNYNRQALQGINVDDMEVVKHFKLDPALAYTPKINDAVNDIIFQKNIEGMVEQGMPPKKASAEAGRIRKQIRVDTNNLLRYRGLSPA